MSLPWSLARSHANLDRFLNSINKTSMQHPCEKQGTAYMNCVKKRLTLHKHDECKRLFMIWFDCMEIGGTDAWKK